MRKLLLGIGIMVLLTACSGSADPAASQPPLAGGITCHTAYRASVERPIEKEESISFTDRSEEQSVAFTDLVFHAAYRVGEGDNERTFRVWVTEVDDGAVYQSQLYQLYPGSGPQNQFVGGHGFTGLNYIYQRTSQAEMQYWCVAD